MVRQLSLLLVAFLLAACAASGTAIPPGGAAGPNTQSAASWMLPEAMGKDLVYTSDINRREVFILSLPSGKLVGTMAFHDVPWGMCVDPSGNVFVTTRTSAMHAKRGAVTEYGHGSVTPILKLNVPGASACAYDPKTGDLAVSAEPNGGARVTISIFSPPWGRGAVRTVNTITLEAQLYLTYDDQGNLFFPTVQYSAGNRLFKLPFGSATPVVVKLLGNQSDGGPLQWYGKYLASEITTVGGEAVEHIKAPRERGHVAGLTTLEGPSMDFGGNEFWIDRDKIASPFAYSDGPDTEVGVWSYPGGSQSGVFNVTGARFLTGVTISRATK